MAGKTLCDISQKRYKKNPDRVKDLVRDADFICRRCFRAARNKKNLCKPEQLGD